MELLSTTTTSVSEGVESSLEWISVVLGNLLSVQRIFSSIELFSHFVIGEHFKSGCHVEPVLFCLFEFFFGLKSALKIQSFYSFLKWNATYSVRIFFVEDIRMSLGSLISVCFFNLLLFSLSVDPKNFVIITFLRLF